MWTGAWAALALFIIPRFRLSLALNNLKWIITSVLLAGLSVTAQARDAAFNYKMECQGCHAIDGRGQNDVIPALNNHMAKFLTVPGGREFLVQVPGAAQAPLSDAETADVLNYMLARFGPVAITQKYPPYTTAEVARLRKTPFTEVKQKRAALVKLIKEQQK
jgi:cytochrome c551/c552